MSVLLSSAYLPPIRYMAKAVQSDGLLIEQQDHFSKQTYRNRCYIAGPNGRLSLVVPITGRDHKQAMKDIQISYREDWERMHWHSIISSYSSSPFFEYFDVELEAILKSGKKFLLDLNMSLLELILKKLKRNVAIELTGEFMKEPLQADYREAFNAKKTAEGMPAYRQVFTEKHGFISDLSVLDLMANKLPGAGAYLDSLVENC